MKEMKSSKVARGILKDDVGDLFPRLMLERMDYIERYIVDYGFTYTFDTFFDKASDAPSAMFTVQSIENKKNVITISLTDLRTIDIYGVTRCVDIYCEDDILHAMASADADDSMDLSYFSANVEKYDEELRGITPVFSLPVAPYDSKVDVMENLIPTLLDEQEKFLAATEEFENMYDPDDELEEPDDWSENSKEPVKSEAAPEGAGKSEGDAVKPDKSENFDKSELYSEESA